MHTLFYHKLIQQRGVTFGINRLGESNLANLPAGYYINGFKVGHVFFRELATDFHYVHYNGKSHYMKTTDGKNTEFPFLDLALDINNNQPVYVVIRDYLKKIYSGIIQSTLISNQMNSNLKYFDRSKYTYLEKIINVFDLFDSWHFRPGYFEIYEREVYNYLVEVLGEWWRSNLVYNNHLHCYYTALYYMIVQNPQINFKMVELEDLDVTSLGEELIEVNKHSNAVWYPVLERVLNGPDLLQRGKDHIESYINFEKKHYYKLKELIK